MELLPFVAVLAVMYFLLIRPQQKRQQETSRLLSSLKEGDDVVTIGGLFGTIVDISDDTVDLQVDAAGQVLRFRRGAIASVETSGDDEADTGEEFELPEDTADEVASD